MTDLSVYARLRREILSCTGTRPKIFEQELAERLGVSRRRCEKALLRLQEQNPVDVRPRSRISGPPHFNIGSGRRCMRCDIFMSVVSVTMRAITHASDAAIASLKDHLLTKARLPIPEWIAANRRFHSALAEICCAASGRLAYAATKLNDQFDRFTFVSVTRLEQPS